MVKGKITNLLLACVMGVSIVAAVDSYAFANAGDNPIWHQNLYTYKDVYEGKYADIFCNPGYTQVTAKKTGYYGALKYARYISSRKQGSSDYITIRRCTTERVSQPCYTNLTKVSDNVARRYHIGYIRMGMDKSSPKVEEYCRTVYKE